MRNYLDYNASTPLDKRVLEAMMPYLSGQYGNASSRHYEGRMAKQAIELAREQLAAAVNAHPSQVIFTSGGTEANNLALKGFQQMHAGAHIACSRIEHASIMVPAKSLKAGEIAVNAQGRVEIDSLPKENGALASIMAVNNETGVIQDIKALAERVRHSGGVVHTDAVQALGKVEVDFAAWGVQMMSLSGHKIYGPKGVGALVVDKAISLYPQLQGGGHEKGRRSGTENVAAIVGFGAAAEMMAGEWPARMKRSMQLRDRLEQNLNKSMDEVCIFSQETERVANTSMFSIPGIDGEAMLMALDEAGFAVSSGSACDSKSIEPSHVLMAMGIDEPTARGAIRVSLGKDSTEQQVDDLVGAVSQVAKKLGKLAAAW
ncbi:MAG: cysteine desulfurase [Gammaproteobacteria bacterium]|nr:cysteine desulfurase [Gammaproteobacteria bacterium]